MRKSSLEPLIEYMAFIRKKWNVFLKYHVNYRKETLLPIHLKMLFNRLVNKYFQNTEKTDSKI